MCGCHHIKPLFPLYNTIILILLLVGLLLSLPRKSGFLDKEHSSIPRAVNERQTDLNADKLFPPLDGVRVVGTKRQTLRKAILRLHAGRFESSISINSMGDE